ncbi:MarR family transcriptional regulator [Fictibacillus sp. Mic-4]|uniref:MarR family winged helix-turn-helix transcriptional regulator n=1 Tax=Fictibacillus sp. Mic-4 TaxID=3132826 RepID=UPI003CFA257C
MKGLTWKINIDELDRIENAYYTIADTVRPQIWEDEGITSTQYQLLKTLSSKDKWTVTELAESMKVRASATTVIIDRLVKRNLVHRYRSELDRRIVYIEITNDGRLAFEKVKEKRNQIVLHYLSKLSEEDYSHLLNSLEKLADIVTNDRKKYDK